MTVFPALGTSVPLWLKIAYAAFLCVLIPVYVRDWGWANFLWLSDICLFSTAIAVIFEQPALAGMMAIGVLPLELAWSADFLTGGKVIGLATYMFDDSKPLFLRGLSLFHLALPPTILWLLYRFGYDTRSLWRQVVLTLLILPLSYLVSSPADNINWVYGPGSEPQHLITPLAYLAIEMVALPLCVLWPMHWLMRRLFATPHSASG
jgi:hypothetical protein